MKMRTCRPRKPCKYSINSDKNGIFITLLPTQVWRIENTVLGGWIRVIYKEIQLNLQEDEFRDLFEIAYVF